MSPYDLFLLLDPIKEVLPSVNAGKFHKFPIKISIIIAPRSLTIILSSYTHNISTVLLSHPDTYHIGALPYLVGHLGLTKTPIYATVPVLKMGQMFAYDAFLCRQASSDFNAFNLDNVDEAFAQITPLRYQQTISINTHQIKSQKNESEGGEDGAEKMITTTTTTTDSDSDSIISRIAPYASGRMVGGSIWKIEKAAEEYVYAIDYNHKKERHLLGTVLESAFSRPTLLITDAWNALAPTPPPKIHMEKALLDAIMTTLEERWQCVDAGGYCRGVLELLLIVERHWSELKLTYPLVFLSTMAYNTLEFAKSQLEWMNDELTRLLGIPKTMLLF